MMVKYWREGYDVVYAQRSTRRDRVMKRLSADRLTDAELLHDMTSKRVPPRIGP